MVKKISVLAFRIFIPKSERENQRKPPPICGNAGIRPFKDDSVERDIKKPCYNLKNRKQQQIVKVKTSFITHTVHRFSFSKFSKLHLQNMNFNYIVSLSIESVFLGPETEKITMKGGHVAQPPFCFPHNQGEKNQFAMHPKVDSSFSLKNRAGMELENVQEWSW